MRSRIACFFLACAFAAPSWSSAQTGQTDPDEQRSLRVREKITVTATRLPEPVRQVGSSVTVIGAEQIRASGAHWLMDVLARVPGISVARTGGPGAVTSVFTRGTGSNHTLVLIDGLKANSPSTGAFDWAYLPASSVQRIEIIRGPQSTLYGSDAMGGVINVITRAGGGAPRFDLSFDAGSYSTARINGGLQGGRDGTRYALGFDYLDTDNISAADSRAGNRERDGFHNAALDARLGHRFASGVDLEGLVTWNSGRSHFDGFDFVLGPVDETNALTDARSLFGAVKLRYGSGVWQAHLTASVSDGRLETHDPDGFTTRSVLDTSIREIDLQNDVRFDGRNTLTAGVEVRREKALSRSESPFGGSGFDEAIDVVGVYAQHRVAVGERVHVGAGVRFEDHEKFGGHGTYQLTAAYTQPGVLRLHGSLGTGFRAPDFNELYFPDFGNPDLGPETNTGWDLGLGGSWARGRVDADLTYFHNDLGDLIEFTFPDGFVNLGQATSRGLEATLRLQPSAGVHLNTSYTFTDAHGRGRDEQLLRRPRQQWSVGLRLTPTASTSLFTEVRHKGLRNDFGTVGTIELPAYTVWNAAAQVQLRGNLQLTGRLDNITDARYQEVWGYGTPGISGYLGLRYRWASGR